jgi:5-methylcytosine-specific restriction endonuclease McrA
MASRDTPSDKDPLDPIVVEFRREKAREERTYRARALKLLPHVCGHCGRAFEGKRLRELTVHHKDHDATHNPPDGSNWELLCRHCHDNEHDRYSVAAALTGDAPASEQKTGGLHQPFAGLADLLKDKKKEKTKE